MERLSLEQLKAMSDEQLHSTWSEGIFPFELTECGTCLTQHSYTGCNSCRKSSFRGKHSEFVKQIQMALGPNVEIEDLRDKLDELYALRLFYDHLYPQPEAQAEKLEQMRIDHYDSLANTR